MSAPPTQLALPRLLTGLRSRDTARLERHLDVHGPLPSVRDLGGPGVIAILDRAGLRGRGGGGFPTTTKMRAVRTARGTPIVVANGCESEPLSAKDALLLAELPHLVLDGAAIAARAVGAGEAILAFDKRDAGVRTSLEHALLERRSAGVDRVRFRLFPAADRFLAGQETALVSQLNGGEAKPTFAPPRPAERGVRRRPTLIQNVETLAHLALIARHGPDWYRQLGVEDEPGSTLVTVCGAVGDAGVYEIECGTPLPVLFEAAGGVARDIGGLLIGGYFGSWLPALALSDVVLSHAGLAAYGGALGCGVVVALPADSCPVSETARVAAYLAEETAGQCGPCVHGTGAVARTLGAIAEGTAAPTAFGDLTRWTAELPGRGACQHPNGLAHFVSSALRTFARKFDDHARHGPCADCTADPVLQVPAARSRRA